MMNSIVINKKALLELEDLDIDPYNDDGNLKPLNEIFDELSNRVDELDNIYHWE